MIYIVQMSSLPEYRREGGHVEGVGSPERDLEAKDALCVSVCVCVCM